MVDFYGWLDTQDKAASLSHVQRQMSRSGGSYQHPYYWAPFVLIGNMDRNADKAGKMVGLSVKH
jgi:CHAT domain-containing protein